MMSPSNKFFQDSNYAFRKIFRKITGKKDPFLCIITPIFDPALTSLKYLIEKLQQQIMRDFIHVIISNGESYETQKFVSKIAKYDPRFIYDEIVFDPTYEQTNIPADLLGNIGARRDYVMQKYDALRYINLGADFSITNNNFFQKLKEKHFESRKDIIVHNVELWNMIFPIYPLKIGHIDLSNFSYSKKIAKKINYFHDLDKKFGAANDYRYFEKIINVSFIDDILGIKDGNESYKGLSEIFGEYNEKKRQNQ